MPQVPTIPAASSGPATPPANASDYLMAAAELHQDGILRQIADIGQVNQDHKYIENIPNDSGLFQPIAEDMKGPNKPLADRAAAMTKHMYDLYKAGDPDVRAVVNEWEKKKHTEGYADNEAGHALAAQSMNEFGSKKTMSRSAIWEAYMSHYGNLQADVGEIEGMPEDERTRLESNSRFDRAGRNEMNMRKINARLSARYK